MNQRRSLMKNSFTTTLNSAPVYPCISTTNIDEILDNFSYDKPSESVYKIIGAQVSVKTAMLTKIKEELKTMRNNEKGWIVFDINPAKNMFSQFATMLNNEGFGMSSEKETLFFDIGVEIETMLQEVLKKNAKILITIENVSKTAEIIQFISEYGKWLRSDYPIYLICTGTPESIQELCNTQNLAFFCRGTTIKSD